MSLQLVRQPSSGSSQGLAWSRSPSVISFIKKGIYTTRGRHAKFYLVIDSGTLPTPGQTLLLTWIDTSLTFTFGGANPSDPLYLTPWSSGWQLASDLNRNPTFAQYYIATCISTAGGGAILLIEATNNGTDYSLSHTGSTMTFGAGTALTAGVDDVLNADYALSMNVELLTNLHTEPRSSGSLTLQASGVLDEPNDLMKLDFYDLHDIARGIVRSKLPDNAWDIFLQDESLAIATLELIEFYAGQQWKARIDSYGDISDYATATFINGGVSLPDMPGDLNDMTSGGLVSFLTAQDRQKIVDINQPEWLSIAVPISNISVKYTVYYSDGSNDVSYKTFAVSFLGGIVTLPAGWTQCGLGDPTKQATYYTVQLMVQYLSFLLPYSEIFTYIIDTRYFRDVRYFIAENSQGGWDTFRTVGVYKLSAKYTVNSSQNALDPDSTAAKGTIQMVINEEEQTETIRTGWLMDRDDAEYYRQLFLSTRILEVIMPLIPKSGATIYKQPYTAYVLEPNSLDIFETSESKWSIEAKISRAHRESNYTRIRSVVQEVFYDSVVELMISGSGSISVTDGCTSNYLQYTVNGVVTVPTAGVITLSGAASYHIRIDAQNLAYLYLTCTTAGTKLTVTRISSSTISAVALYGFDTVYTEYLIERIATLYSVIYFIIETTDASFRVDDLLMAFIRKLNATSIIPVVIDFALSTPTAVGYAAKAQLLTAGGTVSTL